MPIDSLTVVVPHFNRPELLGEALVSIQNQTHKATEVVVIDDCSTPENHSKVRAFSHLASIQSTPTNLGLAGARNFGAQIAKGEWLAFLDDDDLYVANKLERQLRYLGENPECEVLGGGLLMRPPDGPEEYWGGKVTRRLKLADALYYTASMAQSLLIRRDTFLKLGGFDPSLRYLEDYEFGIRILTAGLNMQFLAEPMFIYRRGGRQQLSLQWGKMFAAELTVLRRHRELVRREFGPLGPLRMTARAYKKYGRRKGRMIGRAIWGGGCLLETFIGKQRGEYD